MRGLFHLAKAGFRVVAFLQDWRPAAVYIPLFPFPFSIAPPHRPKAFPHSAAAFFYAIILLFLYKRRLVVWANRMKKRRFALVCWPM